MVNKKISVITTCLNSGIYIEDTVLSILNQKYNNFELIIIDADSTDSTHSIMKKFRNESKIKFYIKKNIGFYEGLKIGVEKSDGEYIMFMPISDSYTSFDWFENCEKILNKNENISLVHGICIHNNDDGSKFFGTATRQNCPSGESFFPFWLASFYAFAEHSFCIRKNIFLECMNVNVFEIDDFNKKNKSDIVSKNKLQFNIFLKLAFNFNRLGYLSFFIPKVTSLVRIHSNSNSENELNNNFDISELYVGMIENYRTQLFTGEIVHHFKNGNGNKIGTLDGYELAKCIKETITFRMYEKKYFGARDKLNQVGHKFTYKTKYIFAFTIRVLIDFYYKLYRLFSI